MKKNNINMFSQKKINGAFYRRPNLKPGMKAKTNFYRIRGLMDVPISPPDFQNVLITRKSLVKKPVKTPTIEVIQRKNAIKPIRPPARSYKKFERKNHPYLKNNSDYIERFCEICGTRDVESEDCPYCSKPLIEQPSSDEEKEIKLPPKLAVTNISRDSDSTLELDCDEEFDYLPEPVTITKKKKFSKGRSVTSSPPRLVGLMDISVSPPSFVEKPALSPNITNGSSKPTPRICWNCGKEGHRFSTCRAPRAKRFCFRCGLMNVTTQSCPKCSNLPVKKPQSVEEQGSEAEDGKSTDSMPLEPVNYVQKVKNPESLSMMPYGYKAKTTSFFNTNGDPILEKELSSKPVIMVMPGATIYFGSKQMM